MSETCPDCGRAKWFANTPERYSDQQHCLWFTNRRTGQRECEELALPRLRARLSSAESVIAAAKVMRDFGYALQLTDGRMYKTPQGKAFDEALAKHEATTNHRD